MFFMRRRSINRGSNTRYSENVRTSVKLLDLYIYLWHRPNIQIEPIDDVNPKRYRPCKIAYRPSTKHEVYISINFTEYNIYLHYIILKRKKIRLIWYWWISLIIQYLIIPFSMHSSLIPIQLLWREFCIFLNERNF